MKKLLALLMALVLVFSFAACGKGEEVAQTTLSEEEAAEKVDQEQDAFFGDDEEEAPADETTAPADTDATVDPEAPTDPEATTAAPAAAMTKEEFVAFLNAETAKIEKSGKYAFNRTCTYINPIDVGDATATLNKIISGIDENSTLDTVVGDFLGIGTKKDTLPQDKLKNDYKVKATTLKAEDLQNFTASNGSYTFTLADATNPKKTGATPLSRFTNDFITHEEVVDGVASMTSLIKVTGTTVNYNKIKVQVKVADGKIVSIKYAYAFDAQLGLKAVVNINGTGSAQTMAEYSAINY